MSEKLRTFIAVELPPAVREKLRRAHESLAAGIEGVRWVRPEGIHLTLKFLGDVRRDRIDNICNVLQDVAEEQPPVDVTVSGAGAFPNLKRPRVLWVGIDRNEALATLAAEIEQALVPLGFEAETRPFKPHLTLGRVNKPARDYRALEKLKQEIFGGFTAAGFKLYQSDLRPGGAVYNVIEEFRFRGRR